MSIIKPLEFTESELNPVPLIIERIKQSAKNLGYKQQDLAIRSGLPQSHISLVFAKKSATIATLVRLAKAVHYELVIDMK